MSTAKADRSQADHPANLAELARHVRVKSTSPDGSVTTTYSGSDGIHVNIDERRLADHSDTTLAEALTAAVRRAVNGARQAHEQLHEVHYGTPTRRANTQATPKSRPSFNFKQYSPRRYVFIVLGGPEQVTIHLRPRAVSALHTAAAISDEVNCALAQAYQGAARQRVRHV